MSIEQAGDGRSGSPERTAEAEALRVLARRPLTVHEIRQRLGRRGHDEEAIRQVVERLLQRNYLNDLELSLQFISTRTARLGQGRARLIRELRQRGVEASLAEQAWDQAVSEGEIDPAATLRRRVRREIDRRGGTLDLRGYRRVFDALLRAGFDSQSVREELASHHRVSDPDALPREPHDDFS